MTDTFFSAATRSTNGCSETTTVSIGTSRPMRDAERPSHIDGGRQKVRLADSEVSC